MNSAKPVLWYQGLFLQPQHFQQFDLYVQSLLEPYAAYIAPHLWGVCELEVRRDDLKRLVFGLERGKCIFPDGTWTDIPGNARVAARSFRKEEMEAGKPFRVYLGLRGWNRARENVTVLPDTGELGEVGTRFVSPTGHEDLRDLHRTGPSAPVRLMEYVLRVFTEKEIEGLTEYSLIPIAELEYDGTELALTRNYVPPVVTVAASDSILQIIENIRERLTSHCNKLEEYKSPKEAQVSEFEPGYVIFLLALRSLNRFVPALCHLTEAPTVHPWCVYGLLRQIIGELSTFSDRVNALGKLPDGTDLVPKYDHANLLACFSEVQVLIGELLGSIIIGPERIIHLGREGGFFTSQLPVELFEGRHAYYLVLKSAEDRNRMLEVMQNIAKVSSVEYMRTLIGRALPGIALEYSLIPPPGLPNRPNTFYFKLDQSHPQWTEIQKNQSICFWWDHAPKDTKAEFVVLRK